MKAWKVLIATDSFKGSRSSLEAAQAIESGIRKVLPNAEVLKFPIADGGEGTLEALIEGIGGVRKRYTVQDPLGREVDAEIALLEDGSVAIEMAQASGIGRLDDSELDPFRASTYGTGQLLSYALDLKPKTVYLGIGGSATNDGGAGLAQALGVRLTDRSGAVVSRGAIGLRELKVIDCKRLDPRLAATEIIVLSDVMNPLCGPEGASYVYGGQKGASPEELAVLDGLLRSYGELLEEVTGQRLIDRPGAGAAGGLGAGLMGFCGASLRGGIGSVMELIGLEEQMQKVDLVITGEGRMDGQSAYGKAPVGVAKMAKSYGKPVIAIVGSRELDLREIYAQGIDLVLDIINEPMEREFAMREADRLIAVAGETAIRAFLLGRAEEKF